MKIYIASLSPSLRSYIFLKICSQTPSVSCLYSEILTINAKERIVVLISLFDIYEIRMIIDKFVSISIGIDITCSEREEK
jgi:hypothetical protein